MERRFYELIRRRDEAWMKGERQRIREESKRRRVFWRWTWNDLIVGGGVGDSLRVGLGSRVV